MNPILFSLILGTGGGPFGGIAAAVAGETWLKTASDESKAWILAFAGGFILSSSFIEMISESLDRSQKGPWWMVFLVLGGIAGGALAHAGVQRLMGAAHVNVKKNPQAAVRQAREIALSLTVINFIEGLPVGAAFAVSERLGLLIGILMILENFTEGITISSDLAGTNASFGRLLWLTTGPTVTLGFGAALAAWLGGISPFVLTAFLAAGGGVMVHMSSGDILNDAEALHHSTIPLTPFFAGVMASALFSWLGG